MKTKYIMALGALGTVLGIGLPSTAVTNVQQPGIYPPQVAPAEPTTAVWDGWEYVGQVGGRVYYQGPNNTWLAMDQRHQQRFEEFRRNNPNWSQPNAQSSQMQNTRSGGSIPNSQPASSESPAVAPATPPSAVWDGNEYVGQVNGQNYYLGPNNTWLAMDPAREQRFEEWRQNNPNLSTSPVVVGQRNPSLINPNREPNSNPNATGTTRSQGPVIVALVAPNANAQENQKSPAMQQNPTWVYPNGQKIQVRDTRYQGHDMGQTRAVAPPVPESNQ